MQPTSLAENLFFSTVRIDTKYAGGNAGSGTGFLYVHRFGDGRSAPFVVSNRHVVAGVESGTVTFIQRNGNEAALGRGYQLALEDWPSHWHAHPSPDIDIAICPFFPLEQQIREQHGVEVFSRYISSDTLPTPEQLAAFDAIESVTFIGYPNGIWDKYNLLPIARRGTTATPISIDFENTPRFLIDASVFPGSSGSPVFLLNQGVYADKLGGAIIGSRVIFLGVVSAVYHRTSHNKIISMPIPTGDQAYSVQQEMIDLGIVLKARTVSETVKAFLDAHQGT